MRLKSLSFAPLVAFAVIGLSAVAGHAETLEITATFSVSADSEEIESSVAAKDGWVESTDNMGETAYVLTRTLKTSDLPIRVVLGPAELTVNKRGQVEFGVSIGDADAGSTTGFQLPMKRGKLSELPKVEISNSAGDYASGAWQFSGKVALEVTP